MSSGKSIGNSLDEAMARLWAAGGSRRRAAELLAIADEQVELARRTLIDDLGIQSGAAMLQVAEAQLNDEVGNGALARAHMQAILAGGDGIELPKLNAIEAVTSAAAPVGAEPVRSPMPTPVASPAPIMNQEPIGGSRRRQAGVEPAPHFEIFGVQVPEASRETANKVAEDGRLAARSGGSATYGGSAFGKHKWRPAVYEGAFREEMTRLAANGSAVSASPAIVAQVELVSAPEATAVVPPVEEPVVQATRAAAQTEASGQRVADEPDPEADRTFGDEAEESGAPPTEDDFPYDIFSQGAAQPPPDRWIEPYAGGTALSTTTKRISMAPALPTDAAQEVRRLQESRPTSDSVVPLPRRPGPRSASG